MHFRACRTPVGVILVPETSLTWPAGQFRHRPDALTQPQIDDVLLPRHPLRQGGTGEREQCKPSEQQERQILGA